MVSAWGGGDGVVTGDAPLTRRFDDGPPAGLWIPRSTRPPILPTERCFIWGVDVAVGLEFGALLLFDVRAVTAELGCAPRLSELVALEMDFVFAGLGFGALLLLGVLFFAVELGRAPRLSGLALVVDFTDGLELDALGGGPDGDLEDEEEDPSDEILPLLLRLEEEDELLFLAGAR